MVRKKPDTAEIESWVAALQDHDGMVREHARERLVSLGSSATSFVLPLLSEQASQTRWEAAKALSQIADPTSIPALLEALEDDDTDVRWLAAEALASIGPPSARPLLETLIERIDSVWTREGTHHVLGQLRDTEIGDRIIGVYKAIGETHADVDIIVAAEHALKNM
jgi:HEAT repeat protein